MFWIKWTAVAIAFIALSGISIKAYGAWHWAKSTKAMSARLGMATLADVQGGADAARGELVRSLPKAAWSASG